MTPLTFYIELELLGAFCIKLRRRSDGWGCVLAAMIKARRCAPPALHTCNWSAGATAGTQNCRMCSQTVFSSFIFPFRFLDGNITALSNMSALRVWKYLHRSYALNPLAELCLMWRWLSRSCLLSCGATSFPNSSCGGGDRCDIHNSHRQIGRYPQIHHRSLNKWRGVDTCRRRRSGHPSPRLRTV